MKNSTKKNLWQKERKIEGGSDKLIYIIKRNSPWQITCSWVRIACNNGKRVLEEVEDHTSFPCKVTNKFTWAFPSIPFKPATTMDYSWTSHNQV